MKRRSGIAAIGFGGSRSHYAYGYARASHRGVECGKCCGHHTCSVARDSSADRYEHAQDRHGYA
jgi:hypothetical protein